MADSGKSDTSSSSPGADAGAGSDASEIRAHWRKTDDYFHAGIRMRAVVSRRTGMRVCLGQVEGPVVNGYFTLATEAVTNEYAHCDDGLPHCLEHLIFLGSELYPHKGVLDQLANRCMAEGTNAWTDADHTAYELTTAGPAGFLSLLPIYMDHILFPTLTESGFLTEVHHVQDDGNDAGVVYCEMQGREVDCDEIVTRELKRALFPGNCGYASETGGLLANLRKLRSDQVRQYHRDYYRPDNLCVIVTGQVPLDSVLRALEQVEQRIVAKGIKSSLRRPWSTPVTPLPPRAAGADVDSDAVIETRFPSDSERTGSVVIGWRGPPWASFTELTALQVLWQYLTYSSVSPLMKAFVECEDPFCSNVAPEVEEFQQTMHVVQFVDVRTAALREIRGRFFEVIRGIVRGGVDMERIAMLVARERRQYVDSLETDPHNIIAFSFISSFLYGERAAPDAASTFSGAGAGASAGAGVALPDASGGHSPSATASGDTRDGMRAHMDMMARLDALPCGADQGSYWTGLMQRYLLDEPSVTVLGSPSAELGKEKAVAEERRVAEQVAALGPERLAECGDELERAVAANEAPPPPGLLEHVPVPDIDVSFVPVVTVTHSSLLDRVPPLPAGAGAGVGVVLGSPGAKHGGGAGAMSQSAMLPVRDSSGSAAAHMSASVVLPDGTEPSGRRPSGGSIGTAGPDDAAGPGRVEAAASSSPAAHTAAGEGAMSESISSGMSWQIVDDRDSVANSASLGSAGGGGKTATGSSSVGRASSHGAVHGGGAAGSATGLVEPQVRQQRNGWETCVTVAVPDKKGNSPADAASVRRHMVADGLAPGVFPLHIQWDHVRSNFVRVTAALDTRSVPDRLRPLAELFTETLFESPIQLADGTVVPHEEVVTSLVAESVSFNACVGLKGRKFRPGSFPQVLSVALKFEGSKYDAAARWLQHVLLRTRFTPERLRVSAAKLLSIADSVTRKCVPMGMSLLRESLFHPTQSNFAATNVVRQQRYLRAVMARLETPEDAAHVCAELEEFRAYVTQPARMHIHVACDIKEAAHPVGAWRDHFSREAWPVGVGVPVPAAASTRVSGVPYVQDLLRPGTLLTSRSRSPSGDGSRRPASLDQVAAMASVETSYLFQAARGVDSFESPDLPALLVAIQCLTAMEGDFFRKIRGMGLAYGYGIDVDPEESLLTFSLMDSSDLLGAYKQACEIVDGYASGATPLSDTTLQAARSTAVFELIYREETVPAAASQSFRNAMRRVAPGYNQRLISAANAVTLPQVEAVLRKYIAPLFEPSKTAMAATTGLGMDVSFAEGMADLGREVRLVGAIEDGFSEDDAADASAAFSSDSATTASGGGLLSGDRRGSASRGTGAAASASERVRAAARSAVRTVAEATNTSERTVTTVAAVAGVALVVTGLLVWARRRR